MGINLPNARGVFLPKVPIEIQDKATREYLDRLKREIETQFAREFDNAYQIVSTTVILNLATASGLMTTISGSVTALYAIIATGTSGTFDDSAGNTVTVATGLITALSA